MTGGADRRGRSGRRVAHGRAVVLSACGRAAFGWAASQPSTSDSTVRPAEVLR